MEVPWCISCYKSHRRFNKSCIVYSVYEGGGAALVDIINDTRFVECCMSLVTTYTPLITVEKMFSQVEKMVSQLEKMISQLRGWDKRTVG